MKKGQKDKILSQSVKIMARQLSSSSSLEGSQIAYRVIANGFKGESSNTIIHWAKPKRIQLFKQSRKKKKKRKPHGKRPSAREGRVWERKGGEDTIKD